MDAAEFSIAWTQALIRFGDDVAQILSSRPATGCLFPQIVRWKESDREKAFIRRLRLAGVSGVSLHCYRYAWAERARTVGYVRRDFSILSRATTQKLPE